VSVGVKGVIKMRVHSAVKKLKISSS
jgi:hypothetical protein